MLDINFYPESGIAIIEPLGALSEADFVELRAVVDPHLEKDGEFRGLIIHTEKFPGWESFAAMVEHFRFVRDHHRRLSHVALVTDSTLANVAESLASHFVEALQLIPLEW